MLAGIAAWGEIQVHATGFRAERACVVAIAAREAPALSPVELDLLAETAAHYGVRLVPAARLRAETERHALPVPETLVPALPRRRARPRKPAPVPVPARQPRGPARGEQVPDGEQSGYWMSAHLAVSCRGTEVTVRPTDAFAALVPEGSRITFTAAGARLEVGDLLAVVHPPAPSGGTGALAIPAPCAGRVTQVNEAAADALAPGRPAPWVARIDAEPVDANLSPVTWGFGARPTYIDYVRHRDDDEILAELSMPRHLRWAGVSSFAGVARTLRAAPPKRLRAPLDDAGGIEGLAGLLDRWIGGDDALAAAMDALGLTARLGSWGSPGSGALIFAGRSVRAESGPRREGAFDLELEIAEEILDELFRGELEIGNALADSIRIRRGNRGQAMLLVSVLQRLFPRYRRHVAVREAERRRASAALRT